VELLVTMMKYKAAGPGTWDRRKRHYRLCTAIMKVMAHMYDVPTEHTGTNMSYKVYKDPLNRRAKYLQDKKWMQLQSFTGRQAAESTCRLAREFCKGTDGKA
jgi:hypothetical protein